MLCDVKFDEYTKYNKMTALHLAAVKGHTACLQLLLEAGGDVTKQDIGGATPLHSAALEGNYQEVRMLVEYGGRTCLGIVCGANKKTPVEIARDEGHKEVFNFLRNVGKGR